MAGAVGYGGKFSKEQLRSDDSILQNVLDNLYKIITEEFPYPALWTKKTWKSLCIYQI